MPLTRIFHGRRHILVTGLLFTLAMTGICILQPSFTTLLNNRIYDTILRNEKKISASNEVVIVDLDEKSLARFGQWPWPRYRVTELLDKIAALAPQVIALDIVFAEPDRTSLDHLEKTFLSEHAIQLTISGAPESLRNNDQAMAKALGRGPFILGYKFLYSEEKEADDGCVLHPVNVGFLSGKADQPSSHSFPRASDAACNLPLLARAVESSGFFDVQPDLDGIIRRVPLLIEYQGGYYPSLALAAMLYREETDQILVNHDSNGSLSLRWGLNTIPVDDNGYMLVNYRGGSGTFPSLSVADILDGKISPELLRGKIVFVGTSATGLRELRATPMDPAFPGVEVHATVADNILQGDFYSSPNYLVGLETMFVFAMGLLSTLLLTWSGAGAGVAVFAFIACLILVSTRWYFLSYGIPVMPLLPLFTLAGNFTLLTVQKFIIEEKRLKQRTGELAKAQEATITGLAALAETRDPETGGHILRTQRYVRTLAEELQKHEKYVRDIDNTAVEWLYKMAPLHDIGKVGIPDSILLKPGRLTAEEFEIMKHHPLLGSRALKIAAQHVDNKKFFQYAIDIAGGHHEKWDGSGYPLGLAGDSIPIAARLMALADVYDALISKRIYKDAMSHVAATTIIMKGSGTHFDPEVVDAFVKRQNTFKDIAAEFSSRDDEILTYPEEDEIFPEGMPEG